MDFEGLSVIWNDLGLFKNDLGSKIHQYYQQSSTELFYESTSQTQDCFRLAPVRLASLARHLAVLEQHQPGT